MRLAEATRLVQQAEAEAARVAEEKRMVEEKRLLEEARLAEQARLVEEKKATELASKLEEEKRLAEAAKLAAEQEIIEANLQEEKRKAEEVRIAEEVRLAEATRLAQQAEAEVERVANEKRLAEVAKIAAEKRLLEEAKLVEKKRLADAAKIATISTQEKSIDLKPVYKVTGKYDAAFVYNLPFKKGEIYNIIQGYQGTVSHQDKFALDFLMPENSEVHAARAGVVMEVVNSNTKGCGAARCAQYDNYIVIVHDDGSYAKYAHLKKSTVSKGDSIKKDQLIAYSGNTGWTVDPSLHFEVFVIKEDDTERTVKTNFLQGDGNNFGILSEKIYYKRGY